MDITFDNRADALYIQFEKSKRLKTTLKLQEGFLVDVDKSGKIYGIEILNVSRKMAVEQLGHVNINLPIHV